MQIMNDLKTSGLLINKSSFQMIINRHGKEAEQSVRLVGSQTELEWQACVCRHTGGSHSRHSQTMSHLVSGEALHSL